MAYVWGKYDQNVIDFMQESCIATFAAKWLDGPVFAKALPDYKGYKPHSYNDSKLVADLWKLLDEADVVVAHNGDNFDVRVIKGRFIFHKLNPPTPFRTVDTKKVAKKVGRFNSNKLDDLGKLLGEGKKIKTDFELWKGCIEGDPAMWTKMVKYNMRDVCLLERIYKRFLPYMTTHPNLGVGKLGDVCPKCGSDKLQYRGYAVSSTRRYSRFQCQDCGGWGRSTKSLDGSKSVNCS